jgi:hypothetical protein
MALLPKPDMPLDGTIRALRELEAASTRLNSPELTRQWQGYLNWTHDVELFFRSYFTGRSSRTALHRPLLARAVPGRVQPVRAGATQQ